MIDTAFPGKVKVSIVPIFQSYGEQCMKGEVRVFIIFLKIT